MAGVVVSGLRRPRTAFEAAFDRACGVAEADYEQPQAEPRPWVDPADYCACSLPGATGRACGDARRLKNPCRCYCHSRKAAAERAAALADLSERVKGAPGKRGGGNG